MRLSEELARVLKPPTRRKRRPADRAPREIVPSEGASSAPGTPRPDGGEDPFAAAQARLKARIPPRDDAADER